LDPKTYCAKYIKNNQILGLDFSKQQKTAKLLQSNEVYKQTFHRTGIPRDSAG
jgi:hypothetical protein